MRISLVRWNKRASDFYPKTRTQERRPVQGLLLFAFLHLRGHSPVGTTPSGDRSNTNVYISPPKKNIEAPKMSVPSRLNVTVFPS